MSNEACSSCKVRFLCFRPWPVTILATAIYVALLIALLFIHYIPPKAPSSDSLESSLGIDLQDVWHTLSAITKRYHPYNSHENEDVRQFLLQKIHAIIGKNGISGLQHAHVVEDKETNVLYAGRGVLPTATGLSVYFESLNIIVVVHGKEDNRGKVLVNAHYDSVSTAPGEHSSSFQMCGLLVDTG